MGKRKNRASKADVQSSPGNQLPTPEADIESADEIMYGSGVDAEPSSRRASNKRKSK